MKHNEEDIPPLTVSQFSPTSQRSSKQVKPSSFFSPLSQQPSIIQLHPNIDETEETKQSLKKMSKDDTIRRLQILRSQSIENFSKIIKTTNCSLEKQKCFLYDDNPTLVRNSVHKSPIPHSSNDLTKFSPSVGPYSSRNNLVHIVIQEKIKGPKPFLTESSSRSKLSNILAKPPAEGRTSIVQEVGSEYESEQRKQISVLNSNSILHSLDYNNQRSQAIEINAMYDRNQGDSKSQPDAEEDQQILNIKHPKETYRSPRYENYGNQKLREWIVRIYLYDYQHRTWDLIPENKVEVQVLIKDLNTMGAEELGNYPSISFNKLVSISRTQMLLMAPLSNQMHLANSVYKVNIDRTSEMVGFSQTSSMVEKRASFASSVLPSQTKVIVTGGLDNLTHAEMYTIAEQDWEILPPLLTGRYDHASCALTDRLIYVFGGRSNFSQPIISIEVYDCERYEWVKLNLNLLGGGSLVRQIPFKYDSEHIILFGGEIISRKNKQFSKSVQIIHVMRRHGPRDIRTTPHSIQMLPSLQRAQNFKDFPLIQIGQTAYFYEGNYNIREMKYGLEVVQESINSEMKFKTFSFAKDIKLEECKFEKREDECPINTTTIMEFTTDGGVQRSINYFTGENLLAKRRNDMRKFSGGGNLMLPDHKGQRRASKISMSSRKSVFMHPTSDSDEDEVKGGCMGGKKKKRKKKQSDEKRKPHFGLKEPSKSKCCLIF